MGSKVRLPIPPSMLASAVVGVALLGAWPGSPERNSTVAWTRPFGLVTTANAQEPGSPKLRRRRPGHAERPVAPTPAPAPRPSVAPAQSDASSGAPPSLTPASQPPAQDSPAPASAPSDSGSPAAPANSVAAPSGPETPIARTRRAPALAPVPDRWRIVESIGVNEHWWDPYNQSTLKADRPAFGEKWFVNLGMISDTLVEARRLPLPRGIQSTEDPGDLDVFGNGDQIIMNQNLIVETALTKGNTTFRPPDWEFRFTGALNANYVDGAERGILRIDPNDGTTRSDAHFGIQELFADRHMGNLSDYYDFYSVRVGIQLFNSDFRGFLYQDAQPGVRLFGNALRNRVQYNLAWFHRLEKDSNSGLNSVFDDRADDIFLASGFLQDIFVKGLVGQALLVYNRNREGDRKPHFNDNGFIERPAPVGSEQPHNYDVLYGGLGVDGHINRLNLTAMGFLAFGEDRNNPIAGQDVDIFSYMLAAEASVDFDWFRLKVFGFHSPGDDDPFDDKAQGFDAIFENPNFAGADTSFWHRQTIPLVGGGGLQLSGRNGILPALRSSKEEGQSNFINPGIRLYGVGGDFDVLPELRFTTNLTRLEFDDTAILRTLLQKREQSSEIGYDLSLALVYRPLFIQNVIFRLSGSALLPGDGFDDIYDSKYDVLYSCLANAILIY